MSKVLDTIFHPYAFHGFAFLAVLLHYTFTNTFTGFIYFIFMVILTVFFLSSLLAIFMMKSDPAVIDKFAQEERKHNKKHKQFKRFSGIALLYLFVILNWTVSFTVWTGILICSLIHSKILENSKKDT